MSLPGPLAGCALPGRPLSGRRVVVTRARAQAGRLSEALRALGAEAIEIPAIEIVPPASYGPLDGALTALSSYDWLIVTSANAVRAIAERAGLPEVRERFAHLRIAAVGSATAEALRRAGLTAALVPREYVAESLAAALHGEALRGKRVLLTRAELARDVVPDALRQAGAQVDVVDAYRNVMPESSVNALRDHYARNPLPDAVTFTSSSTVAHFFALARRAGVEIQPERLRSASIGPVTSATLREHGVEPAIEAAVHDVEGLVCAVVKLLQPGGDQVRPG